MAVTIADLITELDTYIRDTTTDSVSAAERRQALTEATIWLIEQTTNDHAVRTYNIDYAHGVHYYKISSSVPDHLEPVDLRRAEDKHTMPATRKSTREMAEDIGNGTYEFAYAIERKDEAAYLVINLRDSEDTTQIATFDSTTADGGTWTADTTNSDALNVTADSNEYKSGAGSLNFDVDVSQSGNNKAVIYNTGLSSKDLESYEGNGVFILWVYIPDATYTTSVKLYWGSSDSAYWSVTSTTDAEGNAFGDGWNKVSFSWNDATATGTPDSSAIDYVQVDINYGASQADDEDYRLDGLIISRPERLRFHYLSQRVGENSSGTTIYKFTATTDVPFFSGAYDHYKFPVAHKAAETLFRSMGLHQDADYELGKALESLREKQKLFPSSVVKEDRSFKMKQTNFKRRKF